MRFFRWGATTAAEVATFASGHAVLRWTREYAHPEDVATFDLVVSAGQHASVDDLGSYASISLSCPTDASPPILVEPPLVYGTGTEDHGHGEIRWFLEHLGVRVRTKDFSSRKHRSSKQILGLIRRAPAVDGSPCLSAEDAEVFALLGNPVPFLWPGPQFAQWANDLGCSG